MIVKLGREWFSFSTLFIWIPNEVRCFLSILFRAYYDGVRVREAKASQWNLPFGQVKSWQVTMKYLLRKCEMFALRTRNLLNDKRTGIFPRPFVVCIRGGGNLVSPLWGMICFLPNLCIFNKNKKGRARKKARHTSPLYHKEKLLVKRFLENRR